jgi:hypothetical protein
MGSSVGIPGCTTAGTPVTAHSVLVWGSAPAPAPAADRPVLLRCHCLQQFALLMALDHDCVGQMLHSLRNHLAGHG